VDWEEGLLGQIIGPIVSGWSPNCEAAQAGEGEWAILKTTAVVWAGYVQSENKRFASLMRWTAVVNQIRGLLLERGVTLPKGRSHVDEALPEILQDADGAY
jgi:hypothetical protein